MAEDNHSFSATSRRSLSPATSTQGPEWTVRSRSQSLLSMRSRTAPSSAPGCEFQISDFCFAVWEVETTHLKPYAFQVLLLGSLFQYTLCSLRRRYYTQADPFASALQLIDALDTSQAKDLVAARSDGSHGNRAVIVPCQKPVAELLRIGGSSGYSVG